MKFREWKENLGLKSIAIIIFGSFAIILPILYVLIFYFLNILGLKSLLYHKASFYCSILGNITCFLGATILVTVTIISIFIRLNPMSHSKKYIEILKREKYCGILIIALYIFFATMNSAFCSIIQLPISINLVIRDDFLLAELGFLGTMELLYLILLFIIFWLLLELTSTDNIISKAVDCFYQKKDFDNTIPEIRFLRKENFKPIFNIINSSLNDLDVGGAQQGLEKIKDITTYEMNNYKISKGTAFEEIKDNLISNCIEYNESLFRSCIFSIGKGEQNLALELIQYNNDFSNRLFFKILECGESLRQNTILQFQSDDPKKPKGDPNKSKDNGDKFREEYNKHSRKLHQEFKELRKKNKLDLKVKPEKNDSVKFINDIIAESIIKPIDSDRLEKNKLSGDFDYYFDSVLPNLTIARKLRTIGETAINKYYQDIALSALDEISYSCIFYIRFNSLYNTKWTEHHIWYIKDLAICAIDQNQEYISIESIKKIKKISHTLIFHSDLSQDEFIKDITIKSSSAIKEIALIAIDKKYERCTNTAIKSLTNIVEDFHTYFPESYYSSDSKSKCPVQLIVWHLKNIGKLAALNGLEKSVVRTCESLSYIFTKVSKMRSRPVPGTDKDYNFNNKFIQHIIEANCELGDISLNHRLSEAAQILIANEIAILYYLEKTGKYESPNGKMLIKSLYQNLRLNNYDISDDLYEILILISETKENKKSNQQIIEKITESIKEMKEE